MIRFSLHYATRWGEQLELLLRRHHLDVIVAMHHTGAGWWTAIVDDDELDGGGRYRYRVTTAGAVARAEQDWHRLPTVLGGNFHFVDQWNDGVAAVSAVSLRRVIDRGRDAASDDPADGAPSPVTLRVVVPPLRRGLSMAVSGEASPLGAWNPKRVVVMSRESDNVWSLPLDIPPGATVSTQFKFVVIDNAQCDVLEWERGDNRWLTLTVGRDERVLVTHHLPGVSPALCRPACDVTVPLYALRTSRDAGCGDIGDLLKLIDWAATMRHPAVELSCLAHVMGGAPADGAIDPICLALDMQPVIEDAKLRRALTARALELNRADIVDVDEVRRLKMEWAAATLATDQGHAVTRSRDYKRFVNANASWLQPYATRVAGRSRTVVHYVQYLLRRQVAQVLDHAVARDVYLLIAPATVIPPVPRRMTVTLEAHLASRLPNLELPPA